MNKQQIELFSSKKSDEWATPTKFFKDLNNIINFTLDPCATAENHKCDKYYTIENDGLTKSWKNEIVFCNPPYSKNKEWAQKCRDEYLENGTTIALLIPARTSSNYFHDYVLPYATICFIRGRLKFNDGKGDAPFPSILCIYHKDRKEVQRWVREFTQRRAEK